MPVHAEGGEEAEQGRNISPTDRYHSNLEEAHRKLAIRSIPELRRDNAHTELASYTLIDALDQDPRPSFIVDISHPSPQYVPLDLVYCNPALETADSGRLLASVRENYNPDVIFTEIHSAFRQWLFHDQSSVEHNVENRHKSASSERTYLFYGFIWSIVTLRHHRVVSGVPNVRLNQYAPRANTPSMSIDPREEKEPKHLPRIVRPLTIPSQVSGDLGAHNSKHSIMRRSSSSSPPSFDCTGTSIPTNTSAHVRYLRNVDWAGTPIGAMNTWCPQLRSIVNIMLNNSYPAVLFWGPDVTMIYNEAYINVIGPLMHPCMGKSARIVASDYWPQFQPLIDHINATGETLAEHDLPLFLDRHGFLEETFFSFQLIPILDPLGNIGGYYQPLSETTTNKVLGRRMDSLVEIGSQTAKARNMQAYWDLVLNTLRTDEQDVPFALLYAVESNGGPSISTVSSPSSGLDIDDCTLKGSIGAPSGHPIAPIEINLKKNTDMLAPYLWKAAKSRIPTLVHFEELNLPESTFVGVEWKGYGDPCRCLVVCPLLPTTSEQVLGFLVLGINPRCPFDVEYQRFISVTTRLLGTSLASVVLFDDEIRQKEIAIGQAARMQEQLLAQLDVKEKRFQRFAERSDVAIFIIDPNGNYTYRNQRWYEIFKDVVEQDDVMTVWKKIVFPDDIAYCEGLFANLVVEKTPISFELKTNMRWIPPSDMSDSTCDSQDHFSWVLCSAYPELDSDGQLVGLYGSATDISRQKWAEDLQRMRTDSALESKEHLEHFIDTTSHEMRNPLSAIMQCADGIISSYSSPPYISTIAAHTDLVDQTIDAAQTIAQCAQHMKRIVDDILTISKLDSGLLAITPIDVQPVTVTNHAVKMFEPEARAAGINLEFIVENSLQKLGIEWVSLDPTRLLQVLINLITNAIKFTRLESTRLITISMGASEDSPTSIPGGIQYIDTRIVPEHSRLVDDWKQGSTIFLQFSVHDTGRGLAEDEKEKLFARFSQASPRTHINYGGSGLGLFISRRLTEMQGGSIGLASEYKKGSHFAFYVKVRKVTANIRRESLPNVFPEDIRHRSFTQEDKGRPSDLHRPGLAARKQSIAHIDIPATALGHSTTDTSIKDVKHVESLSDKITVLVVEDNLVNQKVLAKQLRNHGCIVSVANHGIEALEHLQRTRYWTSNPPDPGALELSLILMDWEMPVMDGLTCVTKIRELERSGVLNFHIPVIGVTANVRQQQIDAAIEAGMDDVVGKPFRVFELLERMRDLVASNSRRYGPGGDRG